MDSSPEEFGNRIKASLPALQNRVTAEEAQLSREELEHYELKLRLQNEQQNIEERKRYALRIFIMIACWLVAIIAIIVSEGFSWLEISDAVLIALISSTTVSVLAFFLAVTRYLFPNQK